MRLVVVDTNVVVSGALASSEESPPFLILQAMLSSKFRFVISEKLLVEYRKVLLRPHISARHGLSVADVDGLLTDIVVDAVIREPPSTAELGCAAGGDGHLVALLQAVPEAVLVTGDSRLAEEVGSWCSVRSPAEFADEMTE